MKISELTPRQGKVELTAEVIDIQEPRTFNKFGKEGKVANATIKDDTGQVILTLWNEQADQVKKGDTVTIKNGYVGEWQGEMQLSTGKFGTLEISSAEKVASSEENKETSSVEEETVN